MSRPEMMLVRQFTLPVLRILALHPILATRTQVRVEKLCAAIGERLDNDCDARFRGAEPGEATGAGQSAETRVPAMQQGKIGEVDQ